MQLVRSGRRGAVVSFSKRGELYLPSLVRRPPRLIEEIATPDTHEVRDPLVQARASAPELMVPLSGAAGELGQERLHGQRRAGGLVAGLGGFASEQRHEPAP
jgi:hypothetical protein